jgi:hypothetical protein
MSKPVQGPKVPILTGGGKKPSLGAKPPPRKPGRGKKARAGIEGACTAQPPPPTVRNGWKIAVLFLFFYSRFSITMNE